MSNEIKYFCPECRSDHVGTTAEQIFMVNTGDHYCHSVKPQDLNSKAICTECNWVGVLRQLIEK